MLTMGKRFLAIIEKAYRGTVERQYNHVLYTLHALRTMRGEFGILLKGNAVFFALQGQTRHTLTIGEISLTGLPHYESAITALINDGVEIFVSSEDRKKLNMDPSRLILGVNEIDQETITQLFESYDYVWFW